MVFQSVRNRIVTAIPRLTFIKVTLLAASLVISALTQAPWKDPL